MKQKSILGLVIVLITLLPLTTKAITWQDYGNYDISWYRADDSNFDISTPAQLAGVAFLVNNGYTDFKSKNLTISSDINLSGKTWIPIGNAGFHFRGNIDGGYKIICGIDIDKDSAPSPFVNYGFFGYVDNASICNLNFKGQLNFKIDNYFTDQYIGGLSAQIYNSQITNCHSELTVCYDRDHADNAKYTVYVGGIVGYSERNTFENCSYKASLKAGIGGLYDGVHSDRSSYKEGSSVYLGGLCGYDSFSTLRYCSVNITQFIMNIEGSSNSLMNKYAGGLIANSYHSSIHSCRAIIDEVIMKDRGSKSASLSFNGLSWLPANSKDNTNSGIYNCYSVIKKLEFVAGTTSSTVYYGGISAQTYYDNAAYKFKSNYSNSDYALNSYSIPKYERYMGLTTFDSNSMRNNAFCDELNLYFTLNGQEPKWTLEEGGYPIIKQSSNSNGVNSIYGENVINSFSIHKLNGTCVKTNASFEDLKSLPNGIYIINGRIVLKNNNFVN